MFYPFNFSGECEETSHTPDDSTSSKKQEDELENSNPELKTADKEEKSAVAAGKKC